MCFKQQMTGIADPRFIQEIDIGFLSAFFEIIAKGRHAQASDGCNFIQANGFLEIIHRELENPVDPLPAFGIMCLHLAGR